MEITVVVAVIGVILSVLTYFAGVKKTSNGEVEKRAYFEGSITAKLDQLIKSVESLENKWAKNKEDLYSEIETQITQHERRYHHVCE